MTGFAARFALPLLTRELLEQAARRRTYVIRVTYVALFSFLAFSIIGYHRNTSNWWDILGQGLPILRSLVGWEFVGIYVFLPAMACGVITSEKERNTLGLLFLTRLGPWTIIFEKLLSRLVPMLMVLCCALPVMAFTYTMGGLIPFDLFCAAWFLSLAALQVTSAAVMCSAWTHSTTSAFIQTYLMVVGLNLALPTLGSLLPGEFLDQLGITLATWRPPSGNRIYGPGLRGPEMLEQLLSPPQAFTAFTNRWTTVQTAPWSLAIIMGFPTILSALACLLVARLWLYRGAFLQPANPLLRLFRGLDKVFSRVNRKLAFDVKLVRESDVLPGDDPIAWREVTKRALGQIRYLVRIVIPMMLPVVFVGLFVFSSSPSDWGTGSSFAISPLVLFLWIISLTLVVVMAASTIPLERTRQSWDVLRSLPLSGREILRQKLSGVRRLQWVLAIPVLAAICIATWWRQQLFSNELAHSPPGRLFNDHHFLWWEYLFGAVTSVWVYGELAKWLAMWCGLMFKNSIRAIVSALLLVSAMSIVPFVLLVMVFVSLIISVLPVYTFMDVRGGLFSMCPYLFIGHNEYHDLRTINGIPLVPACINLAWHGSLLVLLRRHILKRAEWYLGRIGIRRADAGSVRHVADAASVGGINHAAGVPSC